MINIVLIALKKKKFQLIVSEKTHRNEKESSSYHDNHDINKESQDNHITEDPSPYRTTLCTVS
jgi:hypothetical protein